MRLMQRIKDSIKNDCFPAFVKAFVRNYYSNPKNSEVKTKIADAKAAESSSEKKTESSTAESNESLPSGKRIRIPDWVKNSLSAVNINVSED